MPASFTRFRRARKSVVGDRRWLGGGQPHQGDIANGSSRLLNGTGGWLFLVKLPVKRSKPAPTLVLSDAGTE